MSLRESLTTLNNSLNKDDGIVNTSSASRFLNSPRDIEAQYREYARTHLVQPDISNFIDTLVGHLNDEDEDRSIPGYIVGPYGYGKTSTAGKVWHTLEEEEEYITTPPIYFRDLQSIVDAVYGWMHYRLVDRDEHLEELEKKYQSKVANNIDDILEDTDIDDKGEVKSEIQKLIDKGTIDVDFSVNNVLEFLSECNQIAKDAGYNGLVVLADELQQFVSSHPSDKEAYSELRDIAKSIALGLNDGDGLGLIFTMDDGLHGDLNVNADDVLARLSEQNVKLNLTNVYNRDFPSKLWESLADTYDFAEDRHKVISEDTLDAIGQLCERGPPISNGPRSVVDLLTIGIDHWLSEDELFDALDLADAYTKGIVRYKGDKIKSAITEGLNAEVINTEDRENFIKLCGVFPRGVPDELLKRYNVFEAKEGVKNTLHGQLIITHEEGRTLKSLEREGEDRGIKDELFTQFYQKYDNTDMYDDYVAEVFREVVLEDKVFPAKRGKTLNSWITSHDFEPETDEIHTAVFHGSFDGQGYPKRYVQITTGKSPQGVVSKEAVSNPIDLKMGFILGMKREDITEPHIERPTTDEAIIYLDFLDAFDQLPSNISILESYMSPEDVNPHLLLSLYKFMQNWEKSHRINPSQEEQLEFIRDSLVNQTIQKLFGNPINKEEILTGFENSRRTIQPVKVIKNLFSIMMEDVYPDYNPLYISNSYETFLEDYENMLTGNDPPLRISQKRGSTPIEGSKNEVAQTFGVKSNSTAKTRLDKQFASLVDVERWEGSDARVRLKPHPLEQRILNKLEQHPDERISFEDAYQIGAESGHRSEEVDWALKLLEGREYINRFSDEGVVELDDIAIDPEEVKNQHATLKKNLQTADSMAESWAESESIHQQLSDISSRLENASEEDIELLDELLAELNTVESQINTKLAAIQATYLERCRRKKKDLQDLTSRTPPRDLKKSADGAKVPFTMHLDDIQTHLNSNFQSAINLAEEGEDAIRPMISNRSGMPSGETIENLKKALESAEEVIEDVQMQIREIENRAVDYAEWCSLATKMSDERSDMVRYINNHENPGPVPGIHQQLDSLLGEIQTEFQSDEDQTLRNAGVHAEEFNEIVAEFREIIDGDRNVFSYRKTILENTISEGTGTYARMRINLNPDNPMKSRRDLRDEFLDQITSNDGGIKATLDKIESVRSNLGYAKLLNHVPDDGLVQRDKDRLSNLENRSGCSVADSRNIVKWIENHIEEIETDLNRLDITLHGLEIQDNIPLPKDGDKSDNFPNTDKKLTLEVGSEVVDIAEYLSERDQEVSTIESVISGWRTTSKEPPEELQKITRELDYRSVTDIEKVIINLAEKSEGEFELEDFFDDLQNLFEGNHVTIKLSSEHR